LYTILMMIYCYFGDNDDLGLGFYVLMSYNGCVIQLS
jgi:hypothetical protein